MTGRVWRETNGGNGMRGIEVDGLDLGESGKMVGFGVEGRSLFRRGRETPAKDSAR